MRDSDLIISVPLTGLVPAHIRGILEDDRGLQRHQLSVVLFAATVPHMASFLEHIKPFSDTWCVAIGLESVFHILPYPKEFIFACNSLAPGLLTFLPSLNPV